MTIYSAVACESPHDQTIRLWKTEYNDVWMTEKVKVPHLERHLVVDAFLEQDSGNKLKQVILLTPFPLELGDRFHVEYHYGLGAYAYKRLTNEDLHTEPSNCYGGFFYTDGMPA